MEEMSVEIQTSLESSPKKPRLAGCEVCGDPEARYTCPKCEVKTCSLPCVNVHKKELECDGIRDRTKFVYARDFTNLDLQNDYKLLEECARFVHNKQRNVEKRYTHIDRNLPPHLSKLKRLARSRGTVLLLLLEHFSRRRANTTRTNRDSIQWRVEWNFPNADLPAPLRLSTARCDENIRLASLLGRFMDPDKDCGEEGAKEALVYYHAAGLAGVRVFLKAERIKGCAGMFHELDPTLSLRDNLAGKCIIEFPIIFVILKDHSYNIEIVHSDDETTKEEEPKVAPITSNGDTETVTQNDPIFDNAEVSEGPADSGNPLPFAGMKRKYPPRETATSKFAREERLKIEKELEEERRKKPKNLLFVTGYSSDENDMSCPSDVDCA